MMTKKLLFLAAAALATYSAAAQQVDTAKITVRYKFSHLRDTTDRTKPYTENMILFLGRNASAYKSYDRKIQEAMMRQQMAQQMAEQKGSGSMSISVKSRTPTTNTEYYQFNADKKFIRKERLITPYIIEEAIPAINWKISTDTATYGGMLCQKATARFKGRDYTAWFAPELPFHSGPWKLNGLPGLILEAYDTNKEVVFKFDGMEEVKLAAIAKAKEETAPTPGMPTVRMFGMEDTNEDPNVIKVPTDAVKTSEKEFERLRDAMRKDPMAFAQAAMGGQGIRLGAPGGAPGSGPTNNIRIQSTGGPVINNPLELPEKK